MFSSPLAAFQEVQGRKVGRKPFSQTIEKHISRSFRMSGSLPTAFQEAPSFRMDRKSCKRLPRDGLVGGEISQHLGSRACVQRTSQHTEHVFVECIKGLGGLQDEFRVSSLCFASHELRPGIRLLVSFETIFVGRRAWHRI